MTRVVRVGGWLLPIVIVMAFVACGSSGDRRGDEVRSMIDAVWAAVGIDEETVDVFAYEDLHMEDHVDCAHLDREDRWFGEQSSSIPPGVVEQSEAEAAIVGFLEEEGFEVTRYRSTNPELQVRKYWAERGEMLVDGTLNADGATTVHVRSGPCASLGEIDPERYEPIN